MTLRGKLHPSRWRAALWALRARARCVGRLDGSGLATVVLPRVPKVSDRSRHAVAAALTRTGATCLVRATVLQAWDLAHDHHRDLIVGVTRPSAGFRAHAWLDGDPVGSEGFTELLRVPARPPPAGRRR